MADNHPHAQPANGAGGSAGTHESHADQVPSYGAGAAGQSDQSRGNLAAQKLKAMRGNGNNGAAPPGAGLYPPPAGY